MATNLRPAEVAPPVGWKSPEPSSPPAPIPHVANRRNLLGHLRRTAIRVVLLVALDLSGILAGRAVLRAVRGGALGQSLGHVVRVLLPNVAVPGPQVAVAIVVALLIVGAYRAGDFWRDPVRILSGVGFGVLAALYASLWYRAILPEVGRGIAVWVSLGVTLVALRHVASFVVQRIPRARFQYRVLQIRGPGAPRTLPDLGSSYRTIAVLDSADLPGDIDAMGDWLEGGVDTILVCGEMPGGRFGDLTDFALAHGCHLLTLPRARELLHVDPKRVWVNGIPLIQLTTPSLRASHLLIKRVMDILGSALLIALLIPLDSPGPIFFRHRRAGLGGRFFHLLKFRSMKRDAQRMLFENSELYQRYVQNNFKLPPSEDPRITRLGRILRKTSLDELPQLFNVLRGDMSLVGPRPVVEMELEMYRGRLPTFLSVKPGMTGRWQVSGRSSVAFPERAEMDLEYVRHWSFLEDFWILLMTIPAVLLRRGAH